MDSKISVVINTYNAEKHLAEVLESDKQFDEIVVCDMESTDKTLEIARKYNCKILTFPKGEHKICEPARDFAIHSASNSWVLVVDADEIIPPTLANYLYDAINDPKFSSALAIPRINRFMGKAVTGTPDYQLRFFLKEKAVWPPVIHARPVIDGTVKNLPVKESLSIIHLDDPSISKHISKLNVYSDYEVQKRMKKQYGIGKMLFRPLWFFIKNYVVGKGFKDGKRGVVKSYMVALYQMMLLSKITEYQYKTTENSDT